ncbi:MAG: glycerol kinase GlpK [Gammaproteobacteria bacterium]|nr:glycerol kinase GlpK [Gammaproteobacteria bacterium]MCP5459302.1 glycerol kinase GlpK [Gammaproteobacteria bacterium]
MTRKTALLAIDQGTTSSRAIIFDQDAHILVSAQQEFRQIFPQPGWVEHDPEEIWATTRAVCVQVLEQHGAQVAAIGITNQRETVVIWDRTSGQPVYHAIVWQDRRTAPYCQTLLDGGKEAMITGKTGLLIDPYFSATKIAWILDHVPGARDKAQRGELAFGTIDCFLLWRLTQGRVHATDITNASRTLLFNIHTQAWDEELLALFNIPRSLLPAVRDCASDFGVSTPAALGISLPICGIAGDQQAALIGQVCFAPGMIKSTYGTGCFAILNTGAQPVASRNRLLTTIGYRLNGQTTYALEGSIFMAGAAVQWLRDGLKIIAAAPETEALAASLESNQGIYVVPAYTGLGAPYWDPHARGSIFGLTRAAGPAELARATLESVCYQTHDLLDAMANDGDAPITALRVDGGMVANNWLLQFMADILGITVERPSVIETTALGAAYLAGLQIGLFESLEALEERWQRDRVCQPRLAAADREQLLQGWRKAVACARQFTAQ